MYATKIPSDERSLVLRLIEGGEDAFCELYAAYKNRLIYFAMRFLKSREYAEDIFQDAFTIVWQGRRFINPDASFSAYLYTIVRNRILNQLRDLSYQDKLREQILSQAVNYTNETRDEIIANDLRQFISCALQQLTPRQREIFEMSREQQMSHREIAEVLGISVNTVQESISISLKTLRAYLEKNSIVGAASCVVGLSRWFTDKKRGSFYGFWSASHNIGEAMTFIIVASIVSALGWRYGFLGAGLVGLIGALVVWRFFHDTPQSKGLPAVNAPEKKKEMDALETEEFNRAQKAVLRNPAIWILALSSAFMYISRYAVNSWGVFYLQAEKGYSTLDASFIISISSVFGIVGTMFSGVISDRFFGGRRNIPALIFGLMNVFALCLFLLVPGVHFWMDALAMMLFGLGIGVLICFLGGLMAVDIAPRNASGAALGVVGIASYIGAGLQDVMSGVLIEGNKQLVDGVEVYDFTYINWFWIGAALLSVLLALLVWNARSKE